MPGGQVRGFKVSISRTQNHLTPYPLLKGEGEKTNLAIIPHLVS
jgi:hypothetical protein